MLVAPMNNPNDPFRLRPAAQPHHGAEGPQAHAAPVEPGSGAVRGSGAVLVFGSVFVIALVAVIVRFALSVLKAATHV